jgi:ATP-dependent DNA helicase RecG
VIEVGVNVPTATLMIVENAERFGLSQLHQLRGRVGRGSRKSYCVLVSEASVASEGGEPSPANRRLRTLCTNHDGFAIAEEDLKLRGPGDFFGQMADRGDGIRQSGGLRFRLADIATDAGLLTAASTEAKALLSEDPELLNHPALLGLLERYRPSDAETMN